MASLVNKDFWKKKKVFITGHSGFKGSWLSLWLSKMGAQVVGYSLPPQTEKSLFEVIKIEKKIESHFGDINDFNKLASLIKKTQPDIVIHMAAQALVRYSYDHPIETFQTNVIGTANVLEACRFVDSIKSLVVVTSDKCYENRERLEGYAEHEAMGGYDPYSSSKGCAELVTSAFKRSFFEKSGKGLASARAGNVIGGGDWSVDRLIPDIMRAVIKGEKVVIRNPNAIRPWQHVLEPLSGYLVLAQKLFDNPIKYSEGFNFGPLEKDAETVEHIVKKIVKHWGGGASYQVDANYSGPHEAHYLKLNINKADLVLGWKPTWSLDETLIKTVEWFQAELVGSSQASLMTEKQIEEFESLTRDT